MSQERVYTASLDRYLPTTPMMTAPETARAMGFKTVSALSKARLAGRLPIPMFTVPGRRGWFASTDAVRAWLERTLQTSPEEETK
jgi:hypothetical protein